MKIIGTTLLVLLLTEASGQAVAQEASTTPPANPCETEAHYHDFDFWLGTWEVFVGDKKAGENTISRQEKGCLLLEQWTDVRGGTGQSYNFYIPDTGQWRQVWVSEHIVIDYSGGLSDDGSMQLNGWIVYQAKQNRFDFKGIWTPLEDGSVRQHFEQYDAEKDEWTPLFTGIYRRKQ
jgi:hypothetical protein